MIRSPPRRYEGRATHIEGEYKMRFIKCLWYTCVDAYYFGLKEDCTWVSKVTRYKDGKWYFADAYEGLEGPFDSYRICIKELKMYCLYLEDQCIRPE